MADKTKTKVCSEWPSEGCEQWISERATTCGRKCRNRRTRRLAKEKREAERRQKSGLALGRVARRNPEAHAEVATATRRGGELGADIAHQEIQKVMLPVVREALTDDALRTIQRAIQVTPRSIEVLAELLESDHEPTRLKAADVLLKYTVGNNPIVKDREDDKPVFSVIMGRPGTADPMFAVVQGTTDENTARAELEAAPVIEAHEVRICDICQKEKSADEFIANSNRCKTCQAELVAKVQERFDIATEGGSGGAE